MKTSVTKIIVGIALLIGASAFAADQKAPPAAAGAGTKPGATESAKGEAKGSTAGEAKDIGTTEGKVVPAPEESATVMLKVPAFSSRFAQTPVALVNEDPILMEEFTAALESIHESAGAAGDKKAGKKDYASVLNRIINARLIIQEGTAMGLDELPEVKKQIDAFAESSLKEILKRHQVKNIKPDEKTVETLYQQAVQEWKIRSVRFEKKADAEELAKELKAGGKFDELADKLIDSGKVQGAKEGEFVKPKDLLPQIAGVLSTMKAGEVTPVLPIGPAFTIVKLEEIRYPAGNTAAMEEAQARATELKTMSVLNDYWETLKKKYVKINKKVLDKLDFEAPKPGFKKLLKDKRVVAEIKGEKPVTVGQLAEEIQKKFFHGVEEAIKLKKVNEGKESTLEDMLLDRVFKMEARKQGIDKSEEYRVTNKKYRDSLVFGMFINKAVAPEIKVTVGEIEDYYKEHIADYSSPEMLKIKGLAFARKNDAEDAIDKLRKGAEFQWLQANAAGQVAANSPGLLEFGDTPLITRNLPEQLQKAVAAVKAGDIRLYGSLEGYYYLLYIQDVIPAKPSPLEKERKEIAQKVFGAKMTKAVEEWAEKLRNAYTVKIYLMEQGK
jgi:hypothetical protein